MDSMTQDDFRDLLARKGPGATPGGDNVGHTFNRVPKTSAGRPNNEESQADGDGDSKKKRKNKDYFIQREQKRKQKEKEDAEKTENYRDRAQERREGLGNSVEPIMDSDSDEEELGSAIHEKKQEMALRDKIREQNQRKIDPSKITPKTTLAMSVISNLFKPKRRTKIETFLPGRTNYQFDVSSKSHAANFMPIILKRSRDELSRTQQKDRIMAKTNPQIHDKIDKIMMYVKTGQHGKRMRKKNTATVTKPVVKEEEEEAKKIEYNSDDDLFPGEKALDFVSADKGTKELKLTKDDHELYGNQEATDLAFQEFMNEALDIDTKKEEKQTDEKEKLEEHQKKDMVDIDMYSECYPMHNQGVSMTVVEEENKKSKKTSKLNRDDFRSEEDWRAFQDSRNSFRSANYFGEKDAGKKKNKSKHRKSELNQQYQKVENLMNQYETSSKSSKRDDNDGNRASGTRKGKTHVDPELES
eukprot:CAMPEP_0115039446 /NCGR_PEP_ID=MMETSP0216-20121206/44030_1 /TAXON_ID=223996 /ORGANISM="Protocruzia adherens, Strain Boccale" /LENGTH=470 /DNA_ID=CAMNT_0002420081 /DNA_START=20 /DNA_END=1428 /DNA_ORIENTATION=+